MSDYVCPDRWYDSRWIRDRTAFLDVFRSPDTPVRVAFDDCEWIDMQPLCDLFLQIARFCSRNGKIALQLSKKPLSELSRVHRFLNETGFFTGLDMHVWSPNVSVILGSDNYSLSGFRDICKSRGFRSRELDHETIVPLLLIDTADLGSRADVLYLCEALRQDYLSKGEGKTLGEGRIKAVKIDVPLLHELKLLLGSIIPELVDNVRLHKTYSDSSLAALYIRLRRREEMARSRAVLLAEPEYASLTSIKKHTKHLWQYDTIEAVFADTGESIQDTFVRAWKKRHALTRKKVPKIQDGDTMVRVDGPLADYHILKAIFSNCHSSLSPEERTREKLPVVLTGLYSVKKSLLESNRYFSVQSGQSSVAIGNISIDLDPDTGEQDIRVLPGDRLTGKFDGVHYFFRLASPEGRLLERWADAIGNCDISQDPDWWTYPEEANLSRIHFTSEYKIPRYLLDGSTVLCRANHARPKTFLTDFFKEVLDRNIKVVFAEISPAIALYLAVMLDEIIKHEKLDLLVPMITNTLRVYIPGRSPSKYLPSFLARGEHEKSDGNAWWTEPSSPIRNVRDAFLMCRAYDSRLFWQEISKDPCSFIGQPVNWSDDIILTGGFLSMQMALRNPELSKLVKKRLLVTANALRAESVRVLKPCLRSISREIGELIRTDKNSNVEALLTDILVSERRPKGSGHLPSSKREVWLPVFLYPLTQIETKSGDTYSNRIK